MAAKNVNRVSWTPVRDGHLYCSPACGNGCTHAEYNSARLKAIALQEKLGDDWTANIWENQGWHAKVTGPHTSIKIDPENYVIELNLPGVGQIMETVEDPLAGLDALVSKLKTELTATLKLLKAFDLKDRGDTKE